MAGSFSYDLTSSSSLDLPLLLELSDSLFFIPCSHPLRIVRDIGCFIRQKALSWNWSALVVCILSSHARFVYIWWIRGLFKRSCRLKADVEFDVHLSHARFVFNTCHLGLFKWSSRLQCLTLGLELPWTEENEIDSTEFFSFNRVLTSYAVDDCFVWSGYCLRGGRFTFVNYRRKASRLNPVCSPCTWRVAAGDECQS